MACLEVNVSRKYDKVQVFTRKFYSNTSLSVIKKNRPVKIACTLVCSSPNIPYLIVTPKEIQWISEHNPVEYLIKSNTTWIIYSK